MNQRTEKKGVHQTVVDTIVRRIITETYEPGEKIPDLEALAEELGTSRTTVREAMRVLAAKGFIESRRRAGTRVNPRSHWHLLDSDVLHWLMDGDIAQDIGDSLLVLRRIIEPEAAALAAEYADARRLADIEEAYERMRASLPHDVDAYCNADVDFHTALLAATGNPFLVQLVHTIHTALLVTFEYSTRQSKSHGKTLSLHADIVEQVRARDAQAARATMFALLDKTEADLHVDADGAPPAGRQA